MTEERKRRRKSLRSMKSLRSISSCGSIQEGVKRKRKAKGQIIDYVWYDESSEVSLSKVMKLLRPSKKGKMTIGKCKWRKEAVNLSGTLKSPAPSQLCPSCPHTCNTKNALRVHLYRMHRDGISQKKNAKRDENSEKEVVKFFDGKKTATMKNLASR